MRSWLICWIYLITLGHFACGILLAWFSNNSLFDQYHHAILNQFGDTSANMHSLQIWWLSLFGASLQNLAVFMGILTYVANKYRSALVWLWMIVGLAIWAPQDIFISLQIGLWLHVWVDGIALMVMLPPLAMLWWIDRNSNI